MNRKEIDEAILEAITILKHQNKPVTAANIVELPETKLRLHHIYTSKHIDKIEVRGRNQRLENMRNTRALFSTENSSVDAETAQAAKDRLREKSLGARHLIVEKPSADNTINRVSISLNYTFGGTRMIVSREDADSGDLDEMIEDATFILKKFIERIEREKEKLSK